MLLLEAADVVTGNAEWTLGGDQIDRSCGLEVVLSDYCGPNPEGEYVISQSNADGAMPYRTLPFGIVGRLRRSTRCMQPDDETWLRAQMAAVSEQAVARALTVQPVYGTESWIGADGVTEVEAPSGDRTLGQALCEARTLWSQRNVGVPLVHVAPCAMLQLAQEGVVMIEDGKLWSIWGDQIVTSPGYADAPDAFLTGPITVRLSSIESLTAVNPRINRGAVEATRIGLIEIAPCSMIRIGPAADALPEPVMPTLRVEVTDDNHATAHVDGAEPGSVGSVDWGDGNREPWVQGADAEDSPTLTHTYTTSGTYTVILKPGNATQEITVDVPLVPAPGESEPTIGIDDFTITAEEAQEYQTTLTNREGESQNATSRITFAVEGKTLVPADIVWEEKDLLGVGTGWKPANFTAEDGTLVHVSEPYPIVNPLDGETTCRITAEGQIVAGDVIKGHSEVLASNGAVLAQTDYEITVE